MSANQAEKAKEVEALTARLAEQDAVVITHNNGLTVKQVTEFRAKLRKEGVSYKVTKNTLARRALKGTKFEGLTDLLTGPTGIVSGPDSLTAARVTYAFAKDNDKLVILGGHAGGEKMDVAKIKQLALLPSLDALRGKIVGILYAPGAQLARLAQAYADKGGASAAPASAEASAAETPAADAAPAAEAPAADATPPAETPAT